MSDGKVMHPYRPVKAGAPPTKREREILELVIRGYSSHEIGERLGIATHSVNNYVSAVGAKLGARNRVHLAVLWCGIRPGGARLSG